MRRTALAVVAIAVGCAAEPGVPPPAADSPPSTARMESEINTRREFDQMDRTAERRAANQPLLDEMAAGRRWFHARKTRPIWARQLTAAQRVATLEGEEDVPAGTFLCRGDAGDIWPQARERLEAKYEPAGEPDADGWRKYTPRPDNEGVMAARVDHEFAVEAEWGTLRGKPGDYLVKNYSDRDVAVPDDVWVVDQGLFEATYAPVADPLPDASAGPT